MKTLFEFTLEKKIGETIEKNTYVLIKPNSSLKESAEVFHAVTLSELVAQGVLTRQMLQKRLINDGGTLSDKEKNDIFELYKDFYSLQEQYQKLIIIPKEERTPEQNQDIEDVLVKLTGKQALIVDFERSQIALFDNTAEIIARNRGIFWWILNMVYKKDGEKIVPLFNGKNYSEKKESYDNISEDDFFTNSVWPVLLELVTAWCISGTKKTEDFESIYKEINGRT